MNSNEMDEKFMLMALEEGNAVRIDEIGIFHISYGLLTCCNGRRFNAVRFRWAVFLFEKA